MAKKGITYNLEAEKSVLGSMIASKRVLNDALALLTEDAFYDKNANAVIFRAIKNLDSQQKEVDNASVVIELQNNLKLLDQVGGVQYLADLQDYYIGDKNAQYHIQTVHDLALVRKLFQEVRVLENEYLEKEITDISSYIESFDNRIRKITENRASGDFKETSKVIEGLSKVIKTRKMSNRKSYLTGVDTGYTLLNKYTGGWQKGNLVILAARPSVGKTAFAINLLYNAATKAKKTVAFFSLEMSAEDICTRLLSCVSNVDSTKIKTGDLDDYDWMAIQEAENSLNPTKIYIDDTSGIKIGEIKSKVMKLKSRDSNLGLVVVDYLGLINVANPKQDHRQNIDEISRSLKGIARDLDVPIICLSQLSRTNEKLGRKPMLSDLRDSGAIEQDADMVIFLYREDYQKHAKKSNNQVDVPPMQQQDNSTSATDIILAKNRNGETTEFKLAFIKNVGKFVEFQGERN